MNVFLIRIASLGDFVIILCPPGRPVTVSCILLSASIGPHHQLLRPRNHLFAILLALLHCTCYRRTSQPRCCLSHGHPNQLEQKLVSALVDLYLTLHPQGNMVITGNRPLASYRTQQRARYDGGRRVLAASSGRGESSAMRCSHHCSRPTRPTRHTCRQ